MRRRSVLVPLATTAVLVAGYLGYGAHTRSGDVTYARGGVAFAGSAPEVASTAAAPHRSATGRPTPSPSTAVAGVPSRSSAARSAPSRHAAPSRAARARTVRTEVGPSSAAPAGRAPTSSSRAVPVPGTYRLHVTGKESVRFGPVSFCNRTFPADGTWVVARAAGESPTSYVVDQRLFPADPAQHDERHLYRYEGDRVLLDFEQATVTCAGQRQGTTVDFTPAQLRVRGPLRAGEHWTSTGGDDERTETATTTVQRAETLTVAGRHISTWVVETRVRISGSQSGSRTQRWWWAPSLALPLRVTESIDAARSGAHYTSTLDSTVVGLPAGA